MNDRYLYRAKHRLNSKKWHIGNLVEEPDVLYLRDNKNNIMVYIQDPSTICQCIRREIEHWKDINQNGCNDPFWSDGCNMNLVRNHILYYQRKISEICAEKNLPYPEAYYFSVPPEVDNFYMANLKQRDRVKRIFYGGYVPVRKKYYYDEQQICLF